MNGPGSVVNFGSHTITADVMKIKQRTSCADVASGAMTYNLSSMEV